MDHLMYLVKIFLLYVANSHGAPCENGNNILSMNHHCKLSLSSKFNITFTLNLELKFSINWLNLLFLRFRISFGHQPAQGSIRFGLLTTYVMVASAKV